MIYNFFLVGLGGSCGAICRYGIYLFFENFNRFPVATITVNTIGSFILGGVIGFLGSQASGKHPLMLFLAVGFTGSFTTFSTFALDNISLYESGRTFWALSNIVANVILCISGILLGRALLNWGAP